MVDTVNAPNATITEAKAEFNRSRDRLKKALESTPDDKINWSPSETSRTPIQLVAHAALSVGYMQNWLAGGSMPAMSMAEMDASARSEEKEYTTRAQALAKLDENCDAYTAWLDTLTPEQIAGTMDAGFAQFPMANAITFPADHNRNHAGQLEYIQTIYGDREWRM